jgi:hypothetical protein
MRFWRQNKNRLHGGIASLAWLMTRMEQFAA